MSSLLPLHKTKVVCDFRASRLSTIPSSTAAGSRSRISTVKTGTSRAANGSSTRAPPRSSRAAMWKEALHSTHPPIPNNLGGGNATPGAPPQLLHEGEGNNRRGNVQAVKQQAKQVAMKVIESKVLTALVVFLVTVLMLVCINPPMAQQQLTAEELQGGVQAARSWKKIMVWSLLVFVIALLMPLAAGYWRPAAPVALQ